MKNWLKSMLVRFKNSLDDMWRDEADERLEHEIRSSFNRMSLGEKEVNGLQLKSAILHLAFHKPYVSPAKVLELAHALTTRCQEDYKAGAIGREGATDCMHDLYETFIDAGSRADEDGDDPSAPQTHPLIIHGQNLLHERITGWAVAQSEAIAAEPAGQYQTAVILRNLFRIASLKPQITEAEKAGFSSAVTKLAPALKL